MELHRCSEHDEGLPTPNLEFDCGGFSTPNLEFGCGLPTSNLEFDCGALLDSELR